MKPERVTTIVFVALAGLAGCGVDLELAGETVACGGAAECPAPLSCAVNAGRCVDPSRAETERPQLVNAASTDIATVRLTFSEPVDRAAADPASYTLRPAATIDSAEQSSDLLTVTLHVDGLVPGFEYAVTATGIADLWGNPLGLPDSATFLGFGAFPDRSAPAIIAPASDASATGSVRLVWARVALAYSYTVDVSFDEAFTAPLAASFTVLDPQSSVDFSITTSGPHYWRVRANTTPANTYSESRFIGLGDTVYVYCPSDVVTCSDAGKFGTSTSPLQTLGGGVSLARAIGAHAIHIAARGGDAVYSDAVKVSGDLKIVGGYGPDFAEAARNPRLNVTTVSTRANRQRAVFTMLDSNGTTAIEGLRILGWETYAIIVQGIYNGNVEIRDNEIWSRGFPGRAIYVSDSRTDALDHVVIADNHLFQIVPDDLDNFDNQFVVGQGVAIQNAAASVTNNVWDMPERCNRTATECSALRVDHGAVRYTGNTVNIPADQVDRLATAAIYLTDSSFELRGNAVHVAGTRTDGLNRALWVLNTVPVETAIVANNVFITGGASNGIGSASIRTVSPTQVTSNLFATMASHVDPYALRFIMPTGAVVESNVFIGPPPGDYCFNGEILDSTYPTVSGNVGAACGEVIYHGVHPGGEDTTSVAFTNVADLHFADYPDDVHWTADTPASARNAGPYAGTPP